MATRIGDVTVRARLDAAGVTRGVQDIAREMARLRDIGRMSMRAADLVPQDAVEQGRRIAEQVAAGVRQDARKVSEAVSGAVEDAVQSTGQLSLGLDDQGVEQIQRAAEAVGELQQAASGLNTAAAAQATGELATQTERVAEAVRARADAEQAALAATGDQDAAVRAAAQSYREWGAAARQATQSVEEVAADVAAATAAFRNGEISLDDYTAAIQHARREADLLGVAGGRGLAADIARAEVALADGSAAAQEFANNTRRAMESAATTGASDSSVFTRMKEFDKNVRNTTGGVGRLNNAMVTLARQAAGAHPAVGQLVDVIGTFALGSVAMVAVLAGLAAVAAVWNKISANAREARERMERARDTLERMESTRTFVGGEIGALAPQFREQANELARDIADAEARLAKFEAALGNVSGEGLRDVQRVISQLRSQIAGLNAEWAEAEESARRAEAEVSRAFGALQDRVAQAAQSARLAGMEGDAQARLRVEYEAANAAARARRDLKDELLADTLRTIEAERLLGLAAIDAAEALRRQNAEAETLARTSALMRESAATSPFGLFDAGDLPGQFGEVFQRAESVRAKIEAVSGALEDMRDIGMAAPSGAEELLRRLRAELERADREVAETTASLAAAFDSLDSLSITARVNPEPIQVPAIVDPLSVQALERQFELATGRINEQFARGLIDEAGMEEAGRLNAERFNAGLLREIERLRADGRLAEALELAAQLRVDVDTDSQRVAVQRAEEATRAFNDSIAAGTEVLSAFGDLADAADLLSEEFAGVLRGIETMGGGAIRVRFGEELQREAESAIAAAEELGKAAKTAEQIETAAQAMDKAIGLREQAALAQVSGYLTLASGVAQLAFSLFSQTEAQRAQQRAIEQATEAVARFRVELSGFRPDTASARQSVGEAIGRIDEGRVGRTLDVLRAGEQQRTYLNRVFADLGTSLEEVTAVAESLNIPLFDEAGRFVVENLMLLGDVLGEAIAAMTGFANDIAGLREERELRNRISGTQLDPWQEVEALFSDLGSAAEGLFAQYLAGVDTGDSDAVRAAVLRMFDDFALDGNEVFAALMGDMNREDMIDWFNRVGDSLGRMDEVVNEVVGALTSVPQGFRVLNVELARFNAMQRAQAEELLRQAPPPPDITPRPLPAAPITPAGPQLPETRPPEVGGGGPGRERPVYEITDNRVVTIELAQQPGEDVAALSQRLWDEFEQRMREDNLVQGRSPGDAWGPN